MILIFINLEYYFKSLSNTESISRKVVSLPMNTEMTDEQIEYIVNIIRLFFKN